MAQPPANPPVPVLNRAARVAGVIVGMLVLVAGGVAVFLTDNELGSTALVAAGVVIAALAVFGNRLEAVEAAGVRFELERRARSVRQQAVRARAAGKTEQAAQLEQRAEGLLAAAAMVGTRYEQLRSAEPPGWDRTARMEGLLREARDLDTESLSAADVSRIFGSGSDGDRITALALLEAEPRLARADLLVDAIGHSRSSYEQYHALVAAERAWVHLPAADQDRVRAAVETLLAGPLGEKTSDRRLVARRILEGSGEVKD
ncbi:hypothetical protein AFL01nite_26060 [Aeromicrobium flavum]|uniref:Uncharacterized protein n=1 Tax=Aeromicrobium flavum TaxID=416568 RepID=A0A512HXV1_9ACTN|nr:hypothetical protein [Aeromicrobium flavum]GEO90279.1 hypothetical protein AFL01nite_26060 [Aeromicrobium flavum]